MEIVAMAVALLVFGVYAGIAADQRSALASSTVNACVEGG
jgi:hypothetical protein